VSASSARGAGTGPDALDAADRAERSLQRRDVEGKALGTVTLDPAIFGVAPNEAVMHQVVTAQLAAARSGTQSTRTRAEVRGGGAKPFRQKGTGRARQGSTRAPHWSGGGVALGPKPRSYRQRTPKRMVRLALCSALSDRAATDRVALVDRWPWEQPRTKDAVAALAALDLSGRVLVVLGADDMVAERSFGNLPEVQVTVAGELCAYDVLRNDWVLFTDETLPGVTEAAPDGVLPGVTEDDDNTEVDAAGDEVQALDEDEEAGVHVSEEDEDDA
jgi:large subunit ribosomal protein L4